MIDLLVSGGPQIYSAIYAGLVAFGMALLLVITQDWHSQFSIDSSEGVQKSHSHPTSRIGGLAIAVGVVVGYFFAPENLQVLLRPLIIAGIPAFAFGLLEDVTKRVSVRVRLLATMSSGVLGWGITGYAITRFNIPSMDWLLGYTAVSVAFTALAVGGVANSINIIDGFNGLASGTVVIILSGFAAICLSVGDADLAYVCLILASAVFGFLVLNWPLGKIFLGDGGAYFIGFALAWISVLILTRNPTVSAWAVLLVCAYPILEVLFSMVRRSRNGRKAADPDSLHLHSLVKKHYARYLLPGTSQLVRNSATGATMWIAALLPVLIATSVSTHSIDLMVGLAFCTFLYSASYARLTRLS